jgi:hypothetical protein
MGVMGHWLKLLLPALMALAMASALVVMTASRGLYA